MKLVIEITDPRVIADVQWRITHPDYPLDISIGGIGYTPSSVRIMPENCCEQEGPDVCDHGPYTITEES